MQAQPYDFNLTAGGSQNLAVVGTSFKLLSSTGPVQVLANTGARVLLMPGQGIRRFEFDSLTIIDKSGAANVGQILITGSDDKNAEMIDDRITGEVSVIDGARLRVLANSAFLASRSWTPAAATYGTAEIWNPAGSGKNLIVEEINLMQAGGSGLSYGFAVGWANTAQYAATITAASKKGGGTAGVGVVARNDEAVLLGGLTSSIYSYFPPVNQSMPVGLKEPFVIQPGQALRVQQMSVAVPISVGFQWFEESV